MREWPAEFGPYVLGYQPRSDKRKVSTQLVHELNSLLTSEQVKEKKARAVPKEGPAMAKWKRHSVSTI